MEINVLEAKGLFTDPNPLSSVSPGSLVRCTNVAHDRVNVYEKARGFKPCATLSGTIKKFFEFQNRTLAYYLKGGTTQTLAHDIGGCNFVDYGPVPNANYPMFATSANNNFYLTSDDGIKKIDTVTGDITDAGVPQGLAGIPSLITATTGNVLQNNFRTAYRIIWGYTDANDNLVLGAPSPRMPIKNESGSTKDISINAFIPDDIELTTYFYQVYRSEEVAVATIPLDEMYLVDQINLTDDDLTNGFIVYEDHTPVEDLGGTIYTAPSQQGIENSYFQPPHALDIGTFENVNFYANTKTKQSLLSQLTKTQDTGFGYFTVTGDTVSGSFIITSVSDTSGVSIGQALTGVGINSGTTVLGKTGSTITMSNAATADGITVDLELRDFILIGTEYYYAADTNDSALRYFDANADLETVTVNFLNLVNEISTSYNAYYFGIGDIQKGSFQIEALTFGQAAFEVTSSQGTAFIANLPQTSINEDYGNRLYISLPFQPEAVPVGNFFDVGTKEFYIERILFLRDSWYVFKSNGDIYKGVGSDMGNISIRLFNSNAKLRGIQLPAILDNNIICFTDQGVTVVNDNGINIISYPIERDLFKFSRNRNTAFDDLSFGIGYESDRKYMMFIPTLETDTVATQAFVYNVLTKGWTRLVRDSSYAFWNVREDVLYTATDVISVERKEYNETDYSEREVDVNIVSVSGLIVTLTSTAGLSVGWSLYQNGIKAKISEINGDAITITELRSFLPGAAVVYEPMEFSFTYAAQHYGNYLDNKRHHELIHYVQRANFEGMIQTISNEDLANPDTDTLVPKDSAIPLQYIRGYIPKNQTRSNWLNITISQDEACSNLEYLGYTLMGEVISGRNK